MEHCVCCRFIVLITTLQVQTEKFYHSAADFHQNKRLKSCVTFACVWTAYADDNI